MGCNGHPIDIISFQGASPKQRQKRCRWLCPKTGYPATRRSDGFDSRFHEKMLVSGAYPWLPSGKLLHSYGKSPCLMGKSTMSMAIFHSKLLVYQRVSLFPNKLKPGHWIHDISLPQPCYGWCYTPPLVPRKWAVWHCNSHPHSCHGVSALLVCVCVFLSMRCLISSLFHYYNNELLFIQCQYSENMSRLSIMGYK